MNWMPPAGAVAGILMTVLVLAELEPAWEFEFDWDADCAFEFEFEFEADWAFEEDWVLAPLPWGCWRGRS